MEADAAKMIAATPQWTREKVGAGVAISEDTRTVSRDAPAGWGVQLFDTWFVNTKRAEVNVIDAIFEVEAVTNGQLMLGVVGRNFWPFGWDQPLHASEYAVVASLAKGEVFRKGSSARLLIGDVRPGSRVHVRVEMLRQEMMFNLLDAEGNIVRTTSVGDLPHELTLAVCMGAGPQRVRVVGCSTSHEPADTGKVQKDLWDSDNPQVLDTTKKTNSAVLAAIASLL